MVCTRGVGRFIIACGFLFFGTGAYAQNWPAKPIRWIVPYTPAGLPKAIVIRISSEIARALRDPVLHGKCAALGYVPVGSTPEEYLSFQRSEVAPWANLIKDAGVNAEE